MTGALIILAVTAATGLLLYLLQRLMPRRPDATGDSTTPTTPPAEADDPDNLKVIRIPNTAHIEYIEISEGMLPLAKANPNIEILSEPYDLPFDENGNLF